jgi:hypothetical protein
LSTLWVLEVIIGVLPATIVLAASLFSYVLLLATVPELLAHPDPGAKAALHTVLLTAGMIVGGTLGLVAIAMAFNPDELRSRPRMRRVASLFGCAGVVALVGLVVDEGRRINVYELLVLLGPLIVGLHCLYRVFRTNSTQC